MDSPGEVPSCLLSDDVSATFGCPDSLSACALSDEASAAFHGRPPAGFGDFSPDGATWDSFGADVSPGGISAGLSPVLAAASPLSAASTSPVAAKPGRGRRSRNAALEQQPAGLESASPSRPRRGSPAKSSSAPLHGNDSTKRMWQLEDFEFGPCIGVGSFGRIVTARERQSRVVVVLKAMKKRRIERLKVQRHVAHEIEIQAHLRHPNILQLFGFFWDASHIYMILEHAQRGDLYHLLKKQPHQRFSEEAAAPLIQQIMNAVEYLHRMHVIHRDLKPQNILITHNRQAKLADFGWAVHTYPDQKRWTLCGTLDYLPPEIVHAASGHSFAVDTWGVGVLAFELLEGTPPFSATTCEETYRRILKASPAFSVLKSDSEEPHQKFSLSAGARGLISAFLKKDPAERLPLVEALSHPWLREFAKHADSGGCSPAARAGA